MAELGDSLRQQLYETVHGVLAARAISGSGHGNVSIRIPGRDEMLFTSPPTLNGFDISSIVRVGLDGKLLEGDLPPVQAAVVMMHALIYQERPATGCVIHTHSPYATAFAFAHKPIECWSEAFGILGIEDGVPVASCGPRGSDQALANIRSVLGPKTKAVLLANHGVLAWHEQPQMAVFVGAMVEEAAQAAILAEDLGGPKVIPPALLHASRERMAAFERAGTQHA
jgi:L-fuculose-phosphate aldolase